VIILYVYALYYKKAATKGLWKMPHQQRQRMVTHLEAVAADPQRTDLDIRALTNRSGMRLRVGHWRAIVEVDGNRLIVVVLDIGPRGDIYK